LPTTPTVWLLPLLLLVSGTGAFAQTPPSPSPPQGNPAVPAPVVTKRVDAEYSPEARAAGLQGSVLLTLEVTPEGMVRDVRVRRGLGLGLDERAVAAARQWHYKPFDASVPPMMDVAEIPFQLEPRGRWRIVGSRFSLPPLIPILGPRVKPVLSRYVDPDAGACTKDLVYVPVDLTVGIDGKPNDERVGAAIDGDILKAALDAVQSWEFQPGTIGGQAAVSSGTILLECRAPGTSGSADGSILRVGGGVSQPAVIFKLDPEYTEEARKAKLSGSVMLSVVVDTEGRARDIHVVKALGLGLDEEAIAAVYQWRFRSGMKDGKPVNVRATIQVSFRLL
jgi:TonB family protein